MGKFISVKSFSFFLLCPAIVFGQAAKKFEFVYSITSMPGAVPNTYYSSENLFIRDMMIDPPQKVKIKLTKKERQQIENKINEINFFSYPEVYKFERVDTPAVIGVPSVCSKYSVTVFVNEWPKNVSWNNCHGGGKSKNNQYENLQELSELIWNIIVSKKNFKKAKKPRAMYL